MFLLLPFGIIVIVAALIIIFKAIKIGGTLENIKF